MWFAVRRSWLIITGLIKHILSNISQLIILLIPKITLFLVVRFITVINRILMCIYDAQFKQGLKNDGHKNRVLLS